MAADTELAATDLRQRLGSAEPPRLVDVRTPAEFETAHIPGAHNIPLDLLRAHPEELGRHLDRDIVLICRSGQRAAQAERMLAGAGTSGAQVLRAGMDGWVAAGGPVERGRQTWELDRQVRFTAGLLVLTGLLGSLIVPGLQWFSAAIGAALVVTALLGICPMASLLARMPWNRGVRAVDLDLAVGRLAERG